MRLIPFEPFHTICHGYPENRIFKKSREKKKMKMKKIFFVIAIAFAAINVKAQENNPFDQTGKDFVESLKIIKQDFKDGIIKDFSKEAVSKYSKSLPLKTNIDLDMAATVFAKIKTPDFSIEKAVNESNLSKSSKKILLTLASNPDKFNLSEMKDYLVKETENVKNMDLKGDEKEFVLSTIAITYRELDNTNEQCYCDGHGPNGSGHLDCTTCGVIMGGIIGWSICGPLCGLGGAVVGGVVGALS
jgi:hypothetical protein